MLKIPIKDRVMTSLIVTAPSLNWYLFVPSASDAHDHDKEKARETREPRDQNISNPLTNTTVSHASIVPGYDEGPWWQENTTAWSRPKSDSTRDLKSKTVSEVRPSRQGSTSRSKDVGLARKFTDPRRLTASRWTRIGCVVNVRRDVVRRPDDKKEKEAQTVFHSIPFHPGRSYYESPSYCRHKQRNSLEALSKS